jgi:hypothetical protein
MNQGLLAVWAVSVLLAAIAGWGVAWGAGFLQGVRWERSHKRAWEGRERRRVDRPVEVDRRRPADGPEQSPTSEMSAVRPLPPMQGFGQDAGTDGDPGPAR